MREKKVDESICCHGFSQWVFGVRFQNMALTRLDHRFVDLTRDGHSPTICSTIHLNWRHGANIWLWQTKQAIVRLARTKFDLTRMVSIFETLPLNSCKLTPRKARQPRPCTPRSTPPLPLLFWQYVWYFYWNERTHSWSHHVKSCFVSEIILSPTMKKRRSKQSSEMKKSRRWSFPRGSCNPWHKHRSLHTTTIAWCPWWRFDLPWSLLNDQSDIDQKSAKSTTLTEKIRAILLPKNGGGGTHSSQQLVRYHVHDMWPSVHDAWLFSRKMHVATYSIWDSRVRYYQQILWFHDFTR